MIGRTDWDYFIVKDNFQIFFPEGNYDVRLLAEWYRIIPTKAEKIAYYGDNTEMVKDHLHRFMVHGDVKTRMGNDMHSSPFLNVWCMAIYNYEMELVGFAAQEYSESNGAGEKQIVFFEELNSN